MWCFPDRAQRADHNITCTIYHERTSAQEDLPMAGLLCLCPKILIKSMTFFFFFFKSMTFKIVSRWCVTWPYHAWVRFSKNAVWGVPELHHSMESFLMTLLKANNIPCEAISHQHPETSLWEGDRCPNSTPPVYQSLKGQEYPAAEFLGREQQELSLVAKKRKICSISVFLKKKSSKGLNMKTWTL